MNLEKADFEKITASINEVKKNCRRPVTNIFLDAKLLKETLNAKECLFFNAPHAVFILIPRHHKFYDCLFIACNEEELLKGVEALKNNYQMNSLIRISLVGKEAQVDCIAEKLLGAGFEKGKRLARTLIKAPEKKAVIEANRLLAEDAGKNIVNFTTDDGLECRLEFARPGDENEIMELLLSEFDAANDNLPELEEIAANIEKDQIALVRGDGKILAFTYFEIINGIWYGWYDITRKEYRNNFLFMRIPPFVHWKYGKRGLKIKRTYGWRDTANKRLMKYAIKNNQIPDGTIIYNLNLFPNNK